MEHDQAINFMHELLRLMTQKNGSDLFITAHFPPAIKVDGKVMPVSNQPLLPQHSAELARSIMNDRQATEFEEKRNATSPSRRRESAAFASMRWCNKAVSQSSAGQST